MKFILAFAILLLGMTGFAQNRSGTIVLGKTALEPGMSFDASDTINESETYYIEITNKQHYPGMQDIWIDLDSVSGTPTITVTVYGKKFSDDSYTSLGTPVDYAGTVDTTFNYPITTANRYRYFKVEFAADATEQQSLVSNVIFKNWFTGGDLSTTSLSLSSDLTVAGVSTFTGLITANGGVTLGAGDDLIGSATSDITINTDKFTVAGATGNTVVDGTLDVTGAVSLTAGLDLGTSQALVGTTTLTIGAGTETVAINSSDWDIDATGIMTGMGKISLTGGISFTSNVTQFTDLVTLTATEIVGTDAGDVGHADGAILVAAPGTGFTLEFVSVFFVYDFGVAAYTGGGDDAVIQVGVTGTQVAVTGAITGANLLEAATDAMLRLGSTATELVHADNGAISLFGTALTDPGTAVGELRCYVTYNVITTGL